MNKQKEMMTRANKLKQSGPPWPPLLGAHLPGVSGRGPSPPTEGAGEVNVRALRGMEPRSAGAPPKFSVFSEFMSSGIHEL